LQKSKSDIILFKYRKNIKYEFKFQKIINWYNKVIERPNYLSDEYNSNPFLFRSIIYSPFSGFSIIFIGDSLINILNNYPPKKIGIAP
jgi:hypothetical protein